MKRTLCFLALLGASHGAPPPGFFPALHQVETGGRLGPTLGDGGRALGPLQIHRAAHADAGGTDYALCADLEYSKRIATAYLKRFAPKAWDAGDVQTLARIWSGGPRGHLRSATLPYAAKVLAAGGGK